MKKIILFLISAGIMQGLFAQSDFFYSEKGKKITLKIRKDRVVIRTKSKNNAMENRQFSKFKSVSAMSADCMKADVDPETFNEKDFVDIDGITDWYYMLEFTDGETVALNNQILVRPGTDGSVERIIRESGLSGKIEEQELFVPKERLYLLTLDCKMKDVLSVCRRIYETGIVDYAEPNFYREGMLGNTLWQYQWNLKNIGQEGGTPGIDINVEPAWTNTRGNNIKVAVVDEGVDLTHPDLQANLLTDLGYDATGSGSGGYTGNDVHGTSCAGVIGAINNSIGVVGVASGCKMISVKVFNNGGGFVTDAIKGLRNAGINADVINNSWGFREVNLTAALKASMTAVVDSCVNLGRNGKGCVLVFCSHNDSGALRFPAYLDNVIAVGAINQTGLRIGYSNYGDALDVVAPVHAIGDSICVPTTDLQGSLGDNIASGTAGNYRLNFRGTSAACPQVAGIAALVLSVNSNLTAAEVRSIISMTCRKLDNYVFETTSAHPNGSWNNYVGYGLVDAQAAVQAATCTSFLYNQTISLNRFARNCNNTFPIQNVTVTSNSKLTVKSNEVSINGTFTVNSGSRFEIR